MDRRLQFALVVPEIVIAVASLIFFVQARRYLHAFPALGKHPAVNALATIMLTITVLAVIVTAIVLRRSRVRATPGQEPVPGLDIGLGLR